MSLFEWLGEGFHPGPVGTVDFSGGNSDDQGSSKSRIAVLICFALATTLLGGLGYLIVGVWEVRTVEGLAWSILSTLLYLILGYFVRPQPDTSNVGWLGGLFDHPFRFTDDINRFLIYLMIFLWPGRFVSESLIDVVRLMAHARRASTRRSEADDPASMN